MNAIVGVERRPSVCPHDCPSVCALEVEVIDGVAHRPRARRAPSSPTRRASSARKSPATPSASTIPSRLTQPLRRTGPKGSGQFAPIAWDEALDLVAENFLDAERRHGAESVWPYFYAGTMGLVMRDGIERLTHAKRYSRFFGDICVGIAWPGYFAGTGRLAGVSLARWRSPTASSSGAPTRSPRRSTDDPRDARPQETRRENRRHRHL